jgi:hypothetical protein
MPINPEFAVVAIFASPDPGQGMAEKSGADSPQTSWKAVRQRKRFVLLENGRKPCAIAN